MHGHSQCANSVMNKIQLNAIKWADGKTRQIMIKSACILAKEKVLQLKTDFIRIELVFYLQSPTGINMADKTGAATIRTGRRYRNGISIECCCERLQWTQLLRMDYTLAYWINYSMIRMKVVFFVKIALLFATKYE